ncbi:MAG: 30S ribosomal protein THX [Ferruginibacter sp.]
MQTCLAFFIPLKEKIMGRGDIKTKKGKIFAGSFGKTRPAKVKTAPAAPKEKVEKAEKPAAKRTKKAE